MGDYTLEQHKEFDFTDGMTGMFMLNGDEDEI
jgi:hypothetical protein